MAVANFGDNNVSVLLNGLFGLTVTKALSGNGTVTSSPTGINCGGDCTETYDSGTSVTLTAAADTDSVFGGWSGGGCKGTGTCTVTMNADTTVTATFIRQFTLTVTKAGTGTGTVTSSPAGINCGGDCSEIYNSGTVVTLTATPDTLSVFSGWSGDPDCSDGIVTMDADKTCTATFTKKINVTSPNGGESWAIGRTQTIRWTSLRGQSGKVNIALSRDGGFFWESLFKNTANDGSENWKVTKPATTQGRIRICSLGSPSICDTSDANFTIQ